MNMAKTMTNSNVIYELRQTPSRRLHIKMVIYHIVKHDLMLHHIVIGLAIGFDKFIK